MLDVLDIFSGRKNVRVGANGNPDVVVTLLSSTVRYQRQKREWEKCNLGSFWNKYCSLIIVSRGQWRTHARCVRCVYAPPVKILILRHMRFSHNSINVFLRMQILPWDLMRFCRLTYRTWRRHCAVHVPPSNKLICWRWRRHGRRTSRFSSMANWQYLRQNDPW